VAGIQSGIPRIVGIIASDEPESATQASAIHLQTQADRQHTLLGPAHQISKERNICAANPTRTINSRDDEYLST
jgi:hypothetical protein